MRITCLRRTASGRPCAIPSKLRAIAGKGKRAAADGTLQARSGQRQQDDFVYATPQPAFRLWPSPFLPSIHTAYLALIRVSCPRLTRPSIEGDYSPQQDSSRIKHFFRQSQMSALLKDCCAGLQQALDHFSIQTLNKSQASSLSLSLLPAMPQIFHGRDSEVVKIVQMLDQRYARIAILGPGGIGKTNLARAALHHPLVAA
ncbi:hypothetical protein C8R45DRAFT_936021, partial [Mycena sanguinolenta]